VKVLGLSPIISGKQGRFLRFFDTNSRVTTNEKHGILQKMALKFLSFGKKLADYWESNIF